MAGERKRHPAAFKAEATLTHARKRQVLAGADQLFGHVRRPAATGAEKAEPFGRPGRLKTEPAWLNKSRTDRLRSCGC